MLGAQVVAKFRLLVSTLFIFLAAIFVPLSGLAKAQLSQCDVNDIIAGNPYYDSCGNEAGCDNLVGGDNETQVWNYFKSKSLSDAQVAGIMGNMQQESGFNPEAMQIGGNSTNPYDAGDLGWGIVQWSGNGSSGKSTGDKVAAIAQALGITTPVGNLSTELQMVWGEMGTTSPTGSTDMVDGLKQINDPAQAASYFNSHFESGSDPGQVRESNAVAILAKYGGTGSAFGSSGCQASAGSGSCSMAYDAEYSQEQLAQIFGNPGTAASHPDLHLITADFMGFNVQINPLIENCLNSVQQQIQAANLSYKITSVGCYRFDSDNGSSNIGLKSYHTYGAACDINPYTNNFYDTGSVPYDPNCPAASGVVDSGHCYDMSPQLIQIFENNGFLWGGHFNSVKDYMHFEWHGVVP